MGKSSFEEFVVVTADETTPVWSLLLDVFSEAKRLLLVI